MVEEARLESVYTPKGFRGFESRFLRKVLMIYYRRDFFFMGLINGILK